jgi:hypothetical protein
MESGEQISLLRQIEEAQANSALQLPAHNCFPHNHGRQTVRSVVIPDQLNSHSPLIISGNTSLGMVIGLLAECHQKLATDKAAFDTIQILIGNEPLPTQRTTARLKDSNLATEV